MCYTSKLKWVILVLLSPRIDSTLGFSFTHYSRGLCTRFFFFPITHQTIQYTTVYSVTIMRFYNHYTHGHICMLALPSLSLSFYLSLTLSTYLSFNHTQSVYSLLSHMQPKNSNTICLIFNSTEVTRFLLFRSIFKKGVFKQWKENKYYPRPFFTIRYIYRFSKKLPLFFRCASLNYWCLFHHKRGRGGEKERFITFILQIFSWFVLVKGEQISILSHSIGI